MKRRFPVDGRRVGLGLGLVSALVVGAGCSGSTGSALVTFTAQASGLAGTQDAALTFTTGVGAQVTLTHARLHLGAVYLNESVPSSGAASAPCVQPGIYVGEAFGPLDVDLLSGTALTFPSTAEGTQTAARTAEVWLDGGDVNATDDSTVILSVAGTATQGGQPFPFDAAITIGANRQIRSSNAAMPGANPICHQRIVTPILVDFTPTQGGTLALEIDPRQMFNGVDFTSLTPTTPSPPHYTIPDNDAGGGQALYKGLVANAGVYNFSWKDAAK